MPRTNSKYQYETSPRKLEPNYQPLKKPKIPKKSTAVKPETKKTKKSKAELKKRKSQTIKYIIFGFIIVFAISYRNAQIDENFAKVQSLKQELSDIEKQSAQMEVAIENGLNLNNLELEAKELLGMKKLTSAQTVYVSLPKTDYIETGTEGVKIEEETNTFKGIISWVTNIFK